MTLLIREEPTKTCSELPTVTVARRKGDASLRFQHRTSLGFMANRLVRESREREGGSTCHSHGDCGGAGRRRASIFRIGVRFGCSLRRIQVKDQAELNEKFCAANPNMEHVLVLPASLFGDGQQVICASGPYKLYRI